MKIDELREKRSWIVKNIVLEKHPVWGQKYYTVDEAKEAIQAIDMEITQEEERIRQTKLIADEPLRMRVVEAVREAWSHIPEEGKTNERLRDLFGNIEFFERSIDRYIETGKSEAE